MSDDEKVDGDKGLGEVFKKVLSTGLTAAFMTEDAVKKLTQDLPLPKEIVNGLLANAKNTKEEFVGGVKKEFKQYLDRLDVTKEIDRVLENYDIEVNAKVKFKKKNKKKEE
tara:strand:- start:38 stop:370 length:333 start_codon:yes stop_codon:yes gene_type:complete